MALILSLGQIKAPAERAMQEVVCIRKQPPAVQPHPHLNLEDRELIKANAGKKGEMPTAGKGRWLENAAPKRRHTTSSSIPHSLPLSPSSPADLGRTSPGEMGLGSSFDFSEPQFLFSKIQIASDWLLGEP